MFESINEVKKALSILEGMSEMVRLNYPEPVREVMRKFFDRTKPPAVH